MDGGVLDSFGRLRGLDVVRGHGQIVMDVAVEVERVRSGCERSWDRCRYRTLLRINSKVVVIPKI